MTQGFRVLKGEFSNSSLLPSKAGFVLLRGGTFVKTKNM